MRILHVTDSYAPTIGGLERAVSTIAHHQARRGDEVVVLTARHPDAVNEEWDGNVRVLRRGTLVQSVPGAIVDARRPFHPPMVDPAFRVAAAAILRQWRPRVVHAHGWSQFSLVGATRRLGVPVVATAHDYGHVCAVKIAMFRDGRLCSGPATFKCTRHSLGHYGPKGIGIALGLRASVPRSRRLGWTAISTAVARFGVGSAYELPAVAVVPSYVEDSVLDIPTAPRLPWLPSEPYMLFVGGLSRAKGVPILLEAHARLRAAGLEIPLVLIGTPQSDTPDLDQPGITVRLDVDHGDVMIAWRDATLGVVPSVYPEPFGQVVIESIASGTPIVASAHGGIPDIVDDGVHGLLVRPNDADALKDGIARLWTDHSLRAAMASAGPDRAGRFVISVVAPQIDEFYASVAARVTWTAA